MDVFWWWRGVCCALARIGIHYRVRWLYCIISYFRFCSDLFFPLFCYFIYQLKLIRVAPLSYLLSSIFSVVLEPIRDPTLFFLRSGSIISSLLEDIPDCLSSSLTALVLLLSWFFVMVIWYQFQLSLMSSTSQSIFTLSFVLLCRLYPLLRPSVPSLPSPSSFCAVSDRKSVV